MSTVNNGPQIVKNSLAFVLDPTVSAGFIKTPRQLSNCLLWLDGSDTSTLSLSSNIVSSWSSKGTSALVALPQQLSSLPASNFSPLYVAGAVNGLGAIYFDGSNDYMYVGSLSALANIPGYTSFIVLSPIYLNATQVFAGLQASFSSGTYDFFAYYNSLDTLRTGFDGGGNGALNYTSRNDGQKIIISTVRSAGTANTFVNGYQIQTNGSVNANTDAGISILGIGANTYLSGSQPYKGYICEIVIYNRVLTTTERRQVEYYLSNKWRIPFLQMTLTNRDLIFGKLPTCQNNNIAIIDKSYRLNPANATGSPLQSNFYFADAVTWLSPTVNSTISLEAWVKPNSFTFYGSPGSDLGTIMIANSNFYLSIDGNGKFNIYLVGSTTSTVSHLPSNTSVTRHAWNHVVVTFDGAYIRWYLNGVLDKTSSSTYTLGTLTLTNYLGIGSEGASTFGRFLDGYVSGCKIYGKALTVDEILQNYELSKTEFSNLPNIVTSGLTIYLDTDVYSSYIGSGTTFNDLTGNGNYFQLTNSPTYVSTEPKNFSLSAASSQYFLYYVSIGNPTGNTGLSLPSANSWTCSFWFRTTTNTTYNPFLSHMGSGPVYCLMGTTGTTLTYYHYNGGWFFKNGTTNILDNVWHQAVFVNAGNTMIIYLDGVVERSSFDSTVSGGNNFVNGFGGSWTGNFTGNLTNFMYYNTNLSATQVLQNYNAQKFRFGK
jgi:hypothetical protein